jgi:gliding motility-associated-like protein
LTTQNILNPSLLTSTIAHTDILCNGQTNGSVDLTVNGGTIPYTYHWNNNTTSEDLSAVGAGNYSATITDAGGCTITNGTIITEPQPLVIITSPDVTICRGETTFLTITALGGTGNYQYFWNGMPSTQVLGFSLNHDSTLSAYVIDANGCMSNISESHISVGPPLILTLTQNTDNICPGDPVILTVSISGGFGPPYMLSNQDGLVVTPPILLHPEQTMTYIVTAQDICGTRDTGLVTIHVLPTPPIHFIADTTAGCSPFTVHFLETSPNIGQSYLWNFGDDSDISLAKNPTHIFYQPGTYDVTLTVTSTEGCVSTETKPDFIQVYPKPHSQFTWDPQFASILKPIIQFTSISQNATMHFWFFGDGDSSSVIHPYHRFPNADTYIVSLVTVSDLGCTDTAQAEILIKDDFTIYAPTAFSPDFNNINDVWFVTGHNISEQGFHVAIFDRWGQIIWETDKYNASNPKQFGWDGRYKAGEIVKIDTYIWMITCHDWKGNKKEFTGNVTIIR